MKTACPAATAAFRFRPSMSFTLSWTEKPLGIGHYT